MNYLNLAAAGWAILAKRTRWEENRTAWEARLTLVAIAFHMCATMPW